MPTAPQPSARPDVAAFVAAVRAQFDDLSAEEITELTGGLEADLTDELAESGDSPRERYGDPVEYARELRSAAGLPPRGRGRLNLRRADDLLADLRRQPWWPSVRAFLVTLRPVWWVLRAWIVVEGVLQLFYGGQSGELIAGGFLGGLLLLAAIVASVETGRRTETFDRRRRTALTVVNVLAVLAFIPVLGEATQNYSSYDAGYTEPAPAGLSLDGNAVNNVFPYDEQGRPLTGVQLYDQNGHPLEIGEADRTLNDNYGNEIDLQPGSAQGTPQRWNVFPLKERVYTGEVDANGNDVLQPVRDAQLPFAAVPPLLAAPTATPTASPEASSPEATPTEAPTTEAPTPTPTKS